MKLGTSGFEYEYWAPFLNFYFGILVWLFYLFQIHVYVLNKLFVLTREVYKVKYFTIYFWFTIF